MAIKFASVSTQYLSCSQSPVANGAFTIACWGLKTTLPTTGTAYRLLALTQGGTNIRHTLSITAAGGAQFVSAGTSGNSAANTSTVDTSLNTWAHYAAVVASNSSRTAFLSGVGGPTNTTLYSMPDVNLLQIGASLQTGVVAQALNGNVADAGIWNVALNDAEIATLAKGVSPRLVRPQSLVFYAPLIRDLIDYKGGLTITNNNSATVTDHPRIYY